MMFQGTERGWLIHCGLTMIAMTDRHEKKQKYHTTHPSLYIYSQMLISPTRMVSQIDTSLHSGGMALAERFARLDEKALSFQVLLAQRTIEAL